MNLNYYGLRCDNCNKMMGTILSNYTINVGNNCKVLCPKCFIKYPVEKKEENDVNPNS